MAYVVEQYVDPDGCGNFRIKLSPIRQAVLDIDGLGMTPGQAWIARLFVPHGYRKQGVAKALMLSVLAWADKTRTRLVLVPSPYMDGGLDYDELVTFYRRFGFRWSRKSGCMQRRPCVATSQRVTDRARHGTRKPAGGNRSAQQAAKRVAT